MSTIRFVNATLVCPVEGVRSGDLLVEQGVIARPAATAGVRTIDCGGKLLAPGIVDLGVFAIDPVACRAGGRTRVAAMPEAPGAGGDALAVHRLAGALAGADLAEMAAAREAGAVGIATGRQWIADAGLMRRVLAYAGALGLPTVVHAEDAALVGDAVATDGATATRLGLASAPAIAEAMAVMRDLFLAETTGARIHIRQITTAGALDIIRHAKRAGAPVTCGISPAHLLLSDIAIEDFRTFAKLSPPLRSEADRHACLAAVADGTIDVLCSAHDPRGPEDKRLPFAEAAPGAAGAHTLLALSLGLVRDGLLPVEALFALLAANPARILGLSAGTLQPGMPADLILVDDGIPWQVAADRPVGLAGNTPFDGLPVQGRVLRLFKDGREIAAG